MKKLTLIISLIGLFVFINTNIWAQGPATTTQDITLGMPELCLVSASQGGISLELTTNVAGEAVESSKSDSTSYVVVSSIIASGETRVLNAKVDANVPSGTTLSVFAKDPNPSNSDGNLGTSASELVLTQVDQPIVSAIGSCYTGTGATDGYNLRYTWATVPGSYENLVATGSTVVTVTLTLSAGTL